MRLCTFTHSHGRTVPGALVDDRVIDLERALRERRGSTERCADLGDLLASAAILRAADPRTALAELVAEAAAGMASAGAPDCSERGAEPLLADVRLEAPLRRPSKIVAVGLNYYDHAEEQNRKVPGAPMLFTKAVTSVIGPEQAIQLPEGREQIDLEVELAVIIGKPSAEPVPASASMEHVFGFTVLNDVSDRAAQRSDRQFYRAKSWRTFAPMGPVVVSPDECPHSNLALCSRRNGEVMQQSNTAKMIFSVQALVAYISRFQDLEIGDVITTGTPGGVGVFRDPPVFLKAGDVVECEIEGIGILRNTVSGPGQGSA